jgi:hypothetical protein
MSSTPHLKSLSFHKHCSLSPPSSSNSLQPTTYRQIHKNQIFNNKKVKAKRKGKLKLKIKNKNKKVQNFLHVQTTIHLIIEQTFDNKSLRSLLLLIYVRNFFFFNISKSISLESTKEHKPSTKQVDKRDPN